MASGLPDYYRGIDITYQTLSEMINRPKYGAAQRAASVADAWANDDRPYITVEGKGMIYGGFVYTDPESTQKGGKPMIVVDSFSLSTMDFEDMNALNIIIPNCKPVILTKYDDVNFLYCATFLYGITFETSVAVWYQENDGTTPEIRTELIYALISGSI